MQDQLLVSTVCHRSRDTDSWASFPMYDNTEGLRFQHLERLSPWQLEVNLFFVVWV